MARGAHARDRGEARETPRLAQAVTVARVAGSGLIAAVLIATLAAGTILSAASKLAVRIWLRLGLRRRLIAAMIISPFAGILAGNTGLIPGGDAPALIAGLAGVSVFGLWLWVVQIYGRWRWRRRLGLVVPGSLDAHILDNTSRIGELEHLVAVLREENAALRRGLSAACAAAGMGDPLGYPAQRPWLRVVGDDSGPLPRISLRHGHAQVQRGHLHARTGA